MRFSILGTGVVGKTIAARLAGLEAVMNSIRNGLGMRKAGTRRGPGQPANPHLNAVFTKVHNTL